VSHGCIPRKEGSWQSEMQLRNHYIEGQHEATRRGVVYSVTTHSQLSYLN